MKVPILALLAVIAFPSFGQVNKPLTDRLNDEYKNEGYFNIMKFSFISVSELKQERFVPGEGGFFSELNADGAHVWSFQTINGLFISPHISLGIGIGLEGHHNPDFNTLPIFLDARVYLADDEDSLYTFLDIGSTLRIGGENSTLRKRGSF